MSIDTKLLLGADEYLQGELTAENKHEFVAGEAYAMVDGQLVDRAAGFTGGSLQTKIEGDGTNDPSSPVG